MFDYNLEIDSVQNVIKEIEEGRNVKQKVWGCGEITYNAPTDLIIDTLDILRALEKHEVKLQPVYQERDFEYFDVDEYVLNIFKDMECTNADNTYNYNLPFSNHLDTHMYKSEGSDWVIYAVKVHLCGDVRGNYSPYMIFSVDDEYTLWDAFNECTKQLDIEVDEWEGTVTIYPHEESVCVHVENDDEYIEFESYAYDIEELKEEIKKEIENL